jgi:DNA-binding response OmpR family regulator
VTEAPTDCGAILVVDDDGAFRSFLTQLLRDARYATREAACGRSALEAAAQACPQLVVLDVCLPGLSGYEVCRRLRELYGSALPILFVSGERVDSVDRVAGLLLGADDFLVKPFAPDELLARVQSLLRRAGAPPAAARLPILTRRELEVFRLLANGLSDADIGRRLVISPKTVGSHVAHIYEKLGVRSRVQALAAGYRYRLLDPL